MAPTNGGQINLAGGTVPSPIAVPGRWQPVPIAQFGGTGLVLPPADSAADTAPPPDFGKSKYPLSPPPNSTWPGAPDYRYIVISNPEPTKSAVPPFIPEPPVGYTLRRMVPFGHYDQGDINYEHPLPGPVYNFLFQYIDSRLLAQQGPAPGQQAQNPQPAKQGPSRSGDNCGPDITKVLADHLTALLNQPEGDLPAWPPSGIKILQEYTENNTKALLADPSVTRAGGCPAPECEGTWTVGGKCISGYHVRHLLLPFYIWASYGKTIMKAAMLDHEEHHTVKAPEREHGRDPAYQDAWGDPRYPPKAGLDSFQAMHYADLLFNELVYKAIARVEVRAQSEPGVPRKVTAGDLTGAFAESLPALNVSIGGSAHRPEFHFDTKTIPNDVIWGYIEAKNRYQMDRDDNAGKKPHYATGACDLCVIVVPGPITTLRLPPRDE